MTPQRATEIINNFAGKRLIVLGDLMLDEFIWGEVRRISPEAPVPVVEVKRESWHAGGAGNAVSNLLALGAHAIPIGILGNDWAGQRLRERFVEFGAETKFLIVDETRPTTVKTRIVAHQQQMIRTDRESRVAISERIENQLISAFLEAISVADAIIVSDYDKGSLTPRVLQSVLTAAADAQKTVCLDPKLKNFSAYSPVTVIKPNQLEAERATGIEIVDESSLLTAAHQILLQLNCRYVLITRGEHGMTLVSRDAMTHIPPLAREVFDVTGAGDTVIATLSLALSAGAEMEEAAIIANHAASVVVGKVGTATVSPTELIKAIF